MSSTDGKHEVVASDSRAAPVKRGKKRACVNHCKRFWWLHLIIFICVSVLVICLVIFVGVPNIAQDKVNDAKLKVQGINVVQTTSDSFTMSINSTITTDGTVKAKIYGFTGDMYLEDDPAHTPFITIDFPDTNGDKHQKVNVTQEVKIKNAEAFDKFNVWFYNNETLKVTLDGHTQVKPSGLSKKYGVHFKKTIELAGLNRFNGTTVTNGHIALDPDAPENFNGTANIPNNSIFTLEIGNATFNNYLDGAKIGSLTLDNLTLRPGNNSVDITSNLDQAKVLVAVTSNKYCHSQAIPFQLLGTEVVNHGQHLGYFEAALGSNNQTVPIDIKSIIKQDLGFVPNCEDGSS